MDIFDVLRNIVHHVPGWESDEHQREALDLVDRLEQSVAHILVDKLAAIEQRLAALESVPEPSPPPEPPAPQVLQGQTVISAE